MTLLTAQNVRPADRTPSTRTISWKLPISLRQLGWLAAWISPALLLLSWFWVTRAQLFPEQIVVPPGVVWDAFIELKDSGELQTHLHASLFRLFTGFGLGVVSGVLFGVGLALSQTVRVYFGLLFEALRQVPTLVLIPMFVLFFGIDETLKIVIIVKATFFPVALATQEAVRTIPNQYLELGKVYQLKPLTWFSKIIFPATLPPVLTGIRIALSRSWLILVAVELLAADSGIGQMMEMARQMLRLDIVMVGVILTGLIGFGLDKGLRLVEQLFSRWKPVETRT